MSDHDSKTGATPRPEPPPKRRKVVPRYTSPDELGSLTPIDVDIGSLGDAKRSVPRRRRLSHQRIRPSRTPSRSPSDDELNEAYYSRSSQSHTRSRSPESPLRSRSESRSRSQSRSRSPASTSGGSSPRSLADNVDRRLRLSPGNGDDVTTGGTATPATPPVEKKGPVRPTFEEVRVLAGHPGKAVSQVRISPDGRWIASASSDGTIKIWDAASGAHMETLVGHMAGVSCVAWSPDGGTLASGSDDKAIRLWDRVTGRPKITGKGLGRLVAAKDDGGAVAAPSGRPMPPLLGHHNYVHCLAFSPKGNILASGSYDEAVFLWDVRAGRLMRSLPAHSDPVSGIDFSSDGTLVVSCSTDGLIRIWDPYTGQCLRTLVHEDNPAVTSVCFAPNGRFVLAFNLDNSIRLWDYVDGSVKKTYQGHANSRFAIGGCFGIVPGEGAYVASASEDGEVVLWDVVTKEVVQRVPAHKGGSGARGSGVVCFWVDVHGDNMVSAGQDGSIRIFKRVTREDNDAAAVPETNGVAEGEAEEEAGAPREEGSSTEPPIKQEDDTEMGGT
ncbi:WD domain-containing protein [Colletotrichum sojae]|uniref:Mitochondrial division protein 1 n=1 Tax=Colletotrichum sojae TaxID=2175907 RepID=A0A8H6JGV2_9PEZI|nr:WD domain-containing protein [Colletotrichum sojae]